MKERKWCRHIIWSNKLRRFIRTFYSYYAIGGAIIESNWRFCSICGAKRPKGKSNG